MSAPTTESIRAMLAHGEESIAGKRVGQSTVDDIAVAGAVEITRVLALPLAEHRDAAVAERDALAAEVARLREALAASEKRAAKAAEACEALESLVDYSSRMFHDSTMWESEEETAPRWQAWRNWAYDAIKAAKGAGR